MKFVLAICIALFGLVAYSQARATYNLETLNSVESAASPAVDTEEHVRVARGYGGFPGGYGGFGGFPGGYGGFPGGYGGYGGFPGGYGGGYYPRFGGGGFGGSSASASASASANGGGFGFGR